jgi:pimeloyl-ACP methyl ester carboxylesterase
MRMIVAGTGVFPSVAANYYGNLAEDLDAEIQVLAGYGLADPNQSVEKIRKHIECHGEPATLMGHSQGGLVSALVALRYPHLVEKVVSICGPLRGVPIALFGYYIAPSFRAMAPCSPFVKEIRHTPWPDEVSLHTVHARRDALVPEWSALIEPNAYVIDSTHSKIIEDPDLTILLQNKVL